jgi:hypothetical protein
MHTIFKRAKNYYLQHSRCKPTIYPIEIDGYMVEKNSLKISNSLYGVTQSLDPIWF